MTFPSGPELPIEELHKEYFTNTFPFLLKCFDDFGDIFSLKLGDFGLSNLDTNGIWVFLTKSDDIEKLFKADKSVVYGGEANQIQFQNLVPLLSSTALDENEHLNRRRMLLKFFKNAGGNTDEMRASAEAVLATMPNDKPFSIFSFLKRITYLTIFNTSMSKWGDDETRDVCASLIDLESAETNMEQKRALIADTEQYLINIIRREREKHCQLDPKTFSCVFEYLLFSKDGDDYSVSADAMAQEMVGLLMGGISTTAIMLSWAFSYILSDSGVLRKIHSELKSELNGDPVNAGNIENLSYLNSVVLETLRIQPFMATPGLRLLKKPFEVGGYSLPVGTMVANCSYLMQRREEYYPEPEAFCPERFADGKVSTYKWTPFGGGVRRCVGYNFALHNMKVVIATLLQNIDLELAMPVDGAEFLGAFFGPKGGPLVRAAHKATG